MAFIVRCALLVSPGQENPQSISMLRQVKLQGATVPTLWHLEVANQLGRKLRHGALSQDDVSFAIDLIAELDLVTDSLAFGSVTDIMAYMERYALTAYDATYLFLAVSTKLPLATFDRELIAAAAQAGVALMT